MFYKYWFMAQQTSPQNILIRLGIMALVFVGVTVYYFYKYGFNFSFSGGQGKLIGIGIGLFVALLFSLYKLKDQIL